MTFSETLWLVTGLLFYERRVSYRRLTVELGLDSDMLDNVRQELVVKRLAFDENGEGLTWAGGAEPIANIGANPAISSPLRSAVSGNMSSAPIQSMPSVTAATPSAERRQLTVMFCDLVGSTALSTQMDPEDLRDVITSFQDRCSEAIQRYDGFIARYMGDGMLVYFGYPQAHENDAERAIRAGLDIVESMAVLNSAVGKAHGVVLAVRVGVATGPVVVGDRIGEGAAEEAAVVGETPNLAARLQGVAQPNQLVIGPATHRIVGDVFAFDDSGTHELKGIAEPVQVWRVTGAADIESRHEARRQTGSSPLVGRQEELGLLLRAWETGKDGHGQVVLIQGEPGVGKSRLLEALREPLIDEGYTWVSIRCSPYYASTPLYPVIEHFKRVVMWQAEDDAHSRLEKLEAALRGQSMPLEEVVPLFADLMSLDLPDDRYPTPEMTPQQKREAMLDAIVGWLMELAESKPVLQVWEDLHWADPTTLELLGLYIDQSPTVSMLNVLTYRPEFVPLWSMRSHMTPITLNRLERPEVEAFVSNLADGKPLPREVLEHIVSKADGVPLYVEELTKTILESGVLREEVDRYVLDGTLAEMQIPSTLQDSLMARLDRAPALREVAQRAAVLGREFAYEMLNAVTALAETVLQSVLEQLVDDELLYQRGRGLRARYIFKHALIQDAAYQSLLKRTRQQYHLQVAKVFQERISGQTVQEPELLAHHYSEAGRADESVKYWHMAGRVAAQRSANAEAIAHLRRGLADLESVPENAERDRMELAILKTLGPPIIATQGFGTRDVKNTYERAKWLSDKVEESADQFPVLRGVWNSYLVGGEFLKAKENGEELLRLAKNVGDSSHIVEAYRVMGTISFALGEFESARRYTEAGIHVYEPEKHRSLALVYGGDPRVICQGYGAITLWMLGHPEQAKSWIEEALSRAQGLSLGHAEATASCFQAFLEFLLQDAPAALEAATMTAELSKRFGLEQFVVWSAVYRGWARSVADEGAEGIEEIKGAIETWKGIGHCYLLPHFLGVLADALAKRHQVAEALAAVESALQEATDISEGFMLSELHRLRGELLLSQSAPSRGDAEAEFALAQGIAHQQGAKSMELRSAVSLSRLWQEDGKIQEARELLARVINGFAEGFDTTDLGEARALMDDLQGRRAESVAD